MLNIRRASAGSGKTYTLAKQYILSLIAYKSDKGSWYLRNRRQIEDQLQHILAITFTNKATNEMKQRILANLALLAKAKDGEIDDQKLSKIPYLQEFHLTTGKGYQEIGETSDLALRAILNNYSLFKISTIDSFFQEILRTFTYEANLNDTYQLEIDSSYVSDAAIDSAMHELDTRPYKMGNAAFWLKTLMKEESKKSQRWNPFNKKASSRSIYSKIRSALAQLENENFKDIKTRIDSFFNDEESLQALTDFYTRLQSEANSERENLLYDIKAALAKVRHIIFEFDIDPDRISSSFLKQLDKIEGLKKDDKLKISFNKIIEDQSVFKKKYRTENHPLDLAALAMYGQIEKWIEPDKDSYYKKWQIYGELLPYFGLLLEVRSFLTNVLETNNLIQLSDTGFILRKIIGDDDAPFVYERLGNRIDNYLIDEFQDTSRMQWDIIYPLLNEGLSKNKESLIIGDPKQSIYRFRNADHRLITEVVPKAFPSHIESGYSLADNTNWRSHTNIVKFNNYLFKTLAHRINELSREKATAKDFDNLYSNVVQYPNNQSGKGYVEVRMLKKTSDDEVDDLALSQLASLVVSLIEKGYRPGEIAVLVNTNVKGKEVVENFIAYNAGINQSKNGTPINFISEESLLISSSPAVRIIISVLEKLTRPSVSLNPDNSSNDGDDTINDSKEQKTKYFQWNKIEADYEIFSRENPQLPPAQRIMQFLERQDHSLSLKEMIASLPTPTIAAIVETAVKDFLDPELRKSEAIYIASFQDAVNEYSSSHPNDPASFLEWWYSRGIRLSVSTPENMDAVQIMTIHKSKGLEFKCVIIPFASDSMIPSANKEEWRWVNPVGIDFEGIDTPPVLPIKTSSSLLGSYHEEIYKEYFDQVMTDRLNMYYVAFTRAKNELYIFSKASAKEGYAIHDFLHKILKGEIEPPVFSDEENMSVMDIVDLQMPENEGDEQIIQYGEPFTKEEIELEKLKEKEKNDLKSHPEIHYFKDYFVNSSRPRLRSIATKVIPYSD